MHRPPYRTVKRFDVVDEPPENLNVLANPREIVELPYAPRAMEPHEDAWWQHVHELLIHRVRLSEPRAIDCADPG